MTTLPQKTAVIAGASGLVGQSLLNLLLHGNHYKTVIVLSRSPQNTAHAKVVNYQVNFCKLDSVSINHPIDDVFCCLGTTRRKAGSKEAFKKVDYHYVKNLATWGESKGMSSFSVISSLGSDPTSSSFYLKTKGKMEQMLERIKANAILVYRPSLLLGQRNEFRFTEKLSERLLKIINPYLKGKYAKYRAIQASQVAQAMYQHAQEHELGYRVFESDEMV